MKFSKINIDRSPLSSDDLAQGQNFQNVLNAFNKTSIPWYKSTTFYSLSGLAVVAIVAGLGIYSFSNYNDTAHEDNATKNPVEDALLPYVNPPIAGADTDYAEFIVDAEFGGEFKYGDSKINVPPFTFCDDEGNSLQGKVKLKYREFHDKVDFMMSGIPMAYDSAGTQYHFESAGMLDIRGFQNGEEVKICDKQAINVAMDSQQNGSRFNNYFLDEENRKWDYLGDSEFTQNKVDSVWEDSGGEGDSASILMVYDDELTTLTEDIQKVDKNLAKLEKTKPMKPSEALDGKYQIELDFDEKDYPELAVYTNMLFEVGDENKDFTSEKAGQAWSDMQVSKGKKNGSYVLSFTRPGEVYDVICYPVFEGKSFDEANAIYRKKFSDYKQKKTDLEEERKVLAEKIKQERIQRERELEKQRALFAERRETQRAQQNELAMRSTEMYKSQGNVSRFFRVNQFGTYNSDCPRMLPKGAQVLAHYIDSNGKTIQCSTVYLVELDKNALYSLFNKNDLRFNPKNDNMIWTITSDNKLAIAEPSQLARIDKKQTRCELTMTVFDNKIESTKDAKEILKKYLY